MKIAALLANLGSVRLCYHSCNPQYLSLNISVQRYGKAVYFKALQMLLRLLCYNESNLMLSSIPSHNQVLSGRVKEHKSMQPSPLYYWQEHLREGFYMVIIHAKHHSTCRLCNDLLIQQCLSMIGTDVALMQKVCTVNEEKEVQL